MARSLLFILLLQLCYWTLSAQTKDSVVVLDTPRLSKTAILLDTSNRKPKHSPKKAATRSAILPGWGQAYNGKYWKIPIVYTAIGIPVGTYIYNRKWYKETQKAIGMLSAVPPDTADYKNRIDEKLWVFFDHPESLPALVNYRNEFRRAMDYSLLFVLLAWGLNVVDATVDAHLKDFDVSDDLSMRIKPTILSGTSTAGLSIVFTIGKRPPKGITSRLVNF